MLSRLVTSVRAMPRNSLSALRELSGPLLLLAGIALIAQVGISIMLPLLPVYATRLGATPDVLFWLTSSFAVTSTVGQLGAGFLTERITPRRQIPLGSGFYAASNVLIATATAAVPLVIYRAFAGLGGGVMLIAERLYLVQVTESGRLAFANGVLSAAASIGSVMGPVIGATLAGLDLRFPFLLVATTSTIYAIAALRLPAPKPDEIQQPAATPNVPEAAAVDGTALPAPAAVEPAPTVSRSRAEMVRALGPLLLVNLGLSGTYGAWITTYGVYATTQLGWPAGDVAWVFAYFGVGSIILGPYFSRLADQRGRRRFAALGLSFVLGWAGLLLLGLPQAVLFPVAIFAGGGLTVSQASWFALLGEATGGGRRGRSFGLITALSNLGIVAGAFASTSVWNRFGVHAGLATSMGFLVLAILALALTRRRAAATTRPKVLAGV
ncbi:MAG TPA: MFS transporter [Candidatus Polarisedimenticolia bacterium]|nr:MFS transporter [Candidatus Polarisedimenticolia bacterium]